EKTNQLYDILIEELATLLIYHGVDDSYDYDVLFNEIYQQRCPTLKALDKDLSLRNYPSTSGMVAITDAIVSLAPLSKDALKVYTTEGVYYESSMLSHELNLVESKHPTHNIVTILNSSSPP